jgi:hypothetical protein
MKKKCILPILFLLSLLCPIKIFSAYLLTDENYEKIITREPVKSTLEKMTIFNKNIADDNFTDQINTYHTHMNDLFDALNRAKKNIINQEDTWYIFKIRELRLLFINYLVYYHQRSETLTHSFTYHINSFFNTIEDEQAKKNAQILASFSIRSARKTTGNILIIWDETSKMAYLSLSEDLQFKNNTFPFFNIISEFKLDRKKVNDLLGNRNVFKYEKKISSLKSITYFETFDHNIEVYVEHEDEDTTLKVLAEKRGLIISSDNSNIRSTVEIEEIEEEKITDINTHKKSSKKRTLVKNEELSTLFGSDSAYDLWNKIFESKEIASIQKSCTELFSRETAYKNDNVATTLAGLRDRCFDIFETAITKTTKKEDLLYTLCYVVDIFGGPLVSCLHNNTTFARNFEIRVNRLVNLIPLSDQERKICKILALYTLTQNTLFTRIRDTICLSWNKHSQEASIIFRPKSNIDTEEMLTDKDFEMPFERGSTVVAIPNQKNAFEIKIKQTTKDYIELISCNQITDDLYKNTTYPSDELLTKNDSDRIPIPKTATVIKEKPVAQDNLPPKSNTIKKTEDQKQITNNAATNLTDSSNWFFKLIKTTKQYRSVFLTIGASTIGCLVLYSIIKMQKNYVLTY